MNDEYDDLSFFPDDEAELRELAQRAFQQGDLPQALELAEAWLRLIQKPAEAKQIGNKAAEYAQKHFRIEDTGTILMQLYNELLNSNSKSE